MPHHVVSLKPEPTRLPTKVAAWLWRHHGWVLAGLWVAMQVALLWQHQGPRRVNDTRRYWVYAERIAQDWVFEHDHNLRYVGYPLFISFWLRLGLGSWGVVFGQMLVAGLATWGLYDAVRRLSAGNRLPAAAAAAAVILWRDSQQFNVYLLTESLFTSLICLSFWALAWAQPGGWRRWIGFVVLLSLTAIARPNGFTIVVAALIAVLAELRQRPARRLYYGVLGGLALLLPVAWVVLNKLLLTFTLIETYIRGEIIYAYTDWVVEPTEPLLLPPPDWLPVTRLLYFAVCNPVYFAKLALLKAALFFSYAKSYYSPLHIAAVVLFVYPCYWLAGRSLRQQAIWLPVRVFLAAAVLLQGAVVMLTVEDWDVRFLIPVLPCVFALAALGAQPYLNELQKRWPWLTV